MVIGVRSFLLANLLPFPVPLSYSLVSVRVVAWLLVTSVGTPIVMSNSFAGGVVPLVRPDRPPAGTEVDEIRTVAQRSRAPGDCVAVAMEGVTLLLDRQALVQRVTASPVQWTTEAERLALLKGRQATALLRAASPLADGVQRGNVCRYQITKVLDGEAQSAVLDDIEHGATVVLPTGSDQPLPAVDIRYVGTRCGPMCGRGHIMVYAPGAKRPFLVSDWWVS